MVKYVTVHCDTEHQEVPDWNTTQLPSEWDTPTMFTGREGIHRTGSEGASHGTIHSINY